MIKLVESFNVPKRLLSLWSPSDLKSFLDNDNKDISRAECHVIQSPEEFMKYYKNKDCIIFTVYLTSDNQLMRHIVHSDHERDDIVDEIKNGLIEAFAFTNLNNKSELLAQRKENKLGSRIKTKELTAGDFDKSDMKYTGKDNAPKYLAKYDYDSHSNKVYDKSGYEIDFDRYIKKMNSIKRLSDSFEKKLIDIANQYTDLLETIYKKEISLYRQELTTSTRADSYTLKDIKGDVIEKIREITQRYRMYALIKKELKQHEDKYNKTKSLQDKLAYDEQLQTIQKIEKDIIEIVKNTQQQLKNIKEKFKSSMTNNYDVVEESKSLFTKVFEAVSGPKLVKEVNGYKVYTKPFSKNSIKQLANLENDWQVPRSFNQYKYLIVKPNEYGYLLIGEESRHEYDNSFSYKEEPELIEVLYNLFDFNEFIQQRYVNRNIGNGTDLKKYIDTKEKLIQVLKGGWDLKELSRKVIGNGVLKEFKLSAEEVADILEDADDFVVKALLEAGLINSSILPFLSDIDPTYSNDYNGIKTLFNTETIPEEQLKKLVSAIDPINNKNLLLYLLLHCRNIGNYVTAEQVIELFRHNIGKIGHQMNRNSVFTSNIKEIMKKLKLPKDVINRLVQISQDTFDDYTDEESIKDFSNVSPDKVYYLLLKSPKIVKKALDDGMKIPDYMIIPIKRMLTLRNEKTILRQLEAKYSK